MKLTDFDALTFDCYGTLIDWESGMIAGLKPLVDKVDRKLTRNDILEAHARHESGQQAQTPGRKYFDLLATVVYRRLAEEWGIARFLGGVRQLWPVGEELAGVSRLARSTHLPEAALQVGHTVERRQRKFCRQQRAS